MKGYCYILALSVLCSILTTIFNSIYIGILFLIWISYLFYMKRIGKLLYFVSLFFYIFFSLYVPSIELHQHSITPTELTLHGEITSPITSSNHFLQFEFRENNSNQLIQIMTFDDDNYSYKTTSIQHGAECQIKGILKSPEGSRNPGQFNYQAYLASNHIHYQFEVSKLEDIACHQKSNLSILYKIRESLIQTISNRFSNFTSSWIRALVIGDDQDIPEDVIELFQRWGLSHILAISGLHIGLVVGLLYLLTIKINLLTKEKATTLIIVFLPIYAVIAGGEPSVWRASIMILLGLILRKMKSRFTIIDIISITFILLVLVNRFIIYSVGFQFSFIVTFSIILSKTWLLDSNSYMMQMLKLSFISQFIITPLQMFYFFQFNPLSIFLNLIVVPYFTFFVIPLMFLFIIMMIVPFLYPIIDKVFTFIHEELFLVALNLIDHYLYFPWYTGYTTPFFFIGYYILLYLLMGRIQGGKKKQAFYFGVMLIVLLLSNVVKPYLTPTGQVTMLDVGQGDAIIIELPFRKGVIVIDAGAKVSFEDNTISDSNYSRIIKPFLQYRGIQTIDAIFISHEDVDHSGSVPFLIRDFQVEAVIVSDYYQLDSTLLEEIQNKKTELHRVKSGQEVNIEGKMFKVLSPWVDRNSSNENSLVVQTVLGNKSWLFTGDIEEQAESALLRNYPHLKIDVLKVAHHGSNTSSIPAFISSISPRYALISVGENNRYQHPSEEVIERYKEEGTIIFRTDQLGAIMFRFTEKEGTFYHYQP
ncbi:DNA internalization-related competence protein ComEC/Rec2 [Ornithinibacillus halotolerans]|uniref:DNA internalization-related competence protein ComEC/Rec2 n=1 Tax=Ornithinibacillus halotolerans TaxID=1274357 RepID=A0A916RVW4_9BACI|nr:DNA internalization-related competence protein ComEC/Rec2 [Ornithinibacillus halotolerans]GGA68828.1 DNA internalization-related competence protein ComEC/Rec2 [Ornithinibacillus halotolerans]